MNVTKKELEGKVAVVTGGAGVLGSALAEALLEQGARVVILGRTLSKLETQVDIWKKKGFEHVRGFSADVMDKVALTKVQDAIHKEWGKVDILLNAAGGNHPKATTKVEELALDTPAEDGFFGLDIDAFRQVFDLNFMGTLIPSLVFGQDMVAEGGSIINISSMAAQFPMTKVGGYAAAKAAVDNFTRWLSVHLAKRNIRVNAIAPGFFVSDQNRFLLYQEDGKTLTPRGNKILTHTPMGVFGEPENLKAAAVYLAGSGSSFVTGIVLPVDGGFSAYAGV
ncbi:MAG TPA: SDR family oxidoreductase [Treponemataceae bacterium]|nr:SDR family oxidoreductase [Treponemataceae bacterium]